MNGTHTQRGASIHNALASFVRLSPLLRALYGSWFIISISLVAAAIVTAYLRAFGLAEVPWSLVTMLILGGLGLLYECIYGIVLDAKQ